MSSMKIGDDPRLAALLGNVQTVSTSARPLTEAVRDNLTESYALRYKKPSDDAAAILELVHTFNKLMGYSTADVKDGIGEYFRLLSNRQLPAFEWILEAIHVASKKDDHKRNFPYVVGMIRSWMKYGFGHIPSQEEEEVVSYFEEVTGVEVLPQTRLVIQNLMGVYGAIKVTRMIAHLERNHDISMLMAHVLKSSLEEKFPDKKGR